MAGSGTGHRRLFQLVENEWLVAGLSFLFAGLACYHLYLAMQMDAERFPNRKRS
jgi:hypothetical protein